MRVEKTNKLFYNKWPYKVTCKLVGIRACSYYNLDSIIEWCSPSASFSNPPPYSLTKLTSIDRDELSRFVKKYKKYIGKEIQTRAEGNCFSIFCRDLDLYTDIKKTLKIWVVTVSEPDSDTTLEFLLNQGHRKILKSKLPFDRYQYRIFIERKIVLDLRLRLGAWLCKYKTQIHISKSTKKWLAGDVIYSYADRSILVENGKILSLILLYLGNHCKKVEEFILESSINS